ncbi:hypothetical protein AncyloWKF20_13365 [Ancylobacter sp. WKF20]|uniref:cell division protein FtsL n=1 Tax=Ancylobacter sp. WKF20 TaxID=3039801 RepID=UPI002434639C|nr:hypothetical protein [Ancylobacter sp. WKF20]WGD28783.1 hypothetical protein AncyloWKF20_13365 [Ancylobacter sp. WKF20]
MFRVLNAVSLIALLAAAGAVYHVKYSAASEAQKIAQLRDEIRAERDRIALLNAEWARRTAPDRIQALAENHLDMRPLDVDHMDRLASLPAKPEQNTDALGGMIEALVDGPNPNPAPPAAKTPAPGAARTKPTPVARLPDDAPLPEPTGNGQPLPLSAMPAAGNMAPSRPGFAGPQGSLAGSLNPAAARPLLPPAAVGQ